MTPCSRERKKTKTKKQLFPYLLTRSCSSWLTLAPKATRRVLPDLVRKVLPGNLEEIPHWPGPNPNFLLLLLLLLFLLLSQGLFSVC